MPVHNWTRIFDGAFHDFHQAWVFSIKSSLNKGLLPPGPVDPDGLPVALSIMDPNEVPVVTAAEPYSLLSIHCSDEGDLLRAYAETVARNQPLPEMPLFLSEDRYINVPLEPAYMRAWDEFPEPWREIVEGTSRPPQA